MTTGTRVKYIECAECLPYRGLGTVITADLPHDAVIVLWNDIGVTNLCYKDKLQEVVEDEN